MGMVLCLDIPEKNMCLCPSVISKALYCPERVKNIGSSYAAKMRDGFKKGHEVVYCLVSEQTYSSDLK